MKKTKMTAAERAAAEARIKGLRAEANALVKALKADGANEDANEATQLSIQEVVAPADEEVLTEEAEVTEEVIEIPAQEEEVTEEVTETPVEEVEVAEEVTETPAEEVEVAEEVTEIPAEEVEVTEEVTEIPAEEVEVAEEVTEIPAEEEKVAEEVTEIPAEEEKVAEEVTETPAEEVEVTEEVTETSTEATEVAESQEENEDATGGGIAEIFKWILATAGVIAAVVIAIALLLNLFSKDDNQSSQDGMDTGNAVVETTGAPIVEDEPSGEDEPSDEDKPADEDKPSDEDKPADEDKPSDEDHPVDTDAPEEPLNMDDFTVSVQNIANTLTTDENIATNVDVFVEKIGQDKLEELVEKNGELSVQKAIAEYLAFTPEIKMYQYIRNNGLDYNPNAENDWYDKLDAAEEAYKEATGKNPEGAFMSLEGYDTFKNNREVMKQLIIESGDTALLTWYEAKTDGYDTMVQQQKDTAAAEAYKEEVKLELVNNVNGSVKLLELQLEQKVNGTNVDTFDYTEVYEEFIINNYMYVLAN